MSNISVTTSFSNVAVNTESNVITVTSTPSNIVLSNVNPLAQLLSVTSDIRPEANNIYSLGSTSKRWANLHSTRLTIDQHTVSGAGGVTASLLPSLDNNSISLGSDDFAWDNIHVGNVLLKDGAITDDNSNTSTAWGNLVKIDANTEITGDNLQLSGNQANSNISIRTGPINQGSTAPGILFTGNSDIYIGSLIRSSATDNVTSTGPLKVDSSSGNVEITAPSQLVLGYTSNIQLGGTTKIKGAADFLSTVTAANFIGDGSQLTNLPAQADAVTSVNTQTGAVVLETNDIAENTNLYYTSARTDADIADYTGGMTNATGNITTTANITGSYFIGNGSLLTGIDELTNAQVISHIATVPLAVGGNLSVTGNIDATGNINYQNVTDLYVTDQKITLNANATTDATVEIISNRPQSTHDAKIVWNEPSETWTFMNGDNVYQDILTTSQTRGLVSVTSATASGDGSLAYNNSTGVFTHTPADVPNNTDELSEGSTNEYFTTARANSAITAYTGALANLTGNITTTANISAGNVLGTFIGNITGNVTGSPSSLAGLDTADLAEGTNLYYTTARANTAIGAYTGNLTAVNTTGNITTTANISGGNVLTDHVISDSGQPLQLKGQTNGIELDKTVASAEARIVDIDTTGYGVASADFHTSAPVGTNCPGLFVNLTITSGSPDVTINTMHASGLYAIGQTATGYNSYGAFGQANFTNAVAALNAALSASMQTKGWSLYNATSSRVDTNFPIGTFVTGVSGATMTMSQNATASGTAQSYLLFPGAYSTTQDLGFVVSNTGAGTLPFSHIAVNNYVASLPETLSNVTLDAVSHATSVNLANVVTRHIADLTVGALSAVRINQALLIGANATPDIASVGVGSPTPSDASILGLTLEADGVTTYPTANATPQTKFLINQYTDNSVKALAAVPSWASSFASGNATLDNNQLGAPAFNFKLLNGNKDDRSNLEVLGKSVVGKIQWNAVSDGTATGFISGIDTIYPPASITVMMQDDVAQTSNVSAMDYYLGTTYPTSYRNGANVDGGGIPRTFIANKEGNTVIAAKTDGKVTLRPVRDYGDTGTDTSFVQNRYPNELHEYHEFLGAGFLSSKAGTIVEIQPKSGETGGSANFNYDSKGNATLRISSHEANNAVKAQWDITNEQSSGNLVVRSHTSSKNYVQIDTATGMDLINVGNITGEGGLDISTTSVNPIRILNNGLELAQKTTTEINAIASPRTGSMFYNTTLNQICFYNGTAWQKITSATM